MKRIFKYMGLSVFISLFVVACEEEATILNPDVSHNKPTEIVGGDSPRLCSELQKDNQQIFLVVTDEENKVVTDQVSVVLNEAATESENLTVVVDNDFDVEAFRLEVTNSNYRLLPKDAYELDNDGKVAISAGDIQSDKFSLKIKGWMLPVPNDAELETTQYILPLRVKEKNGYETLIYRINWTNGKHRLVISKGYTSIVYVDTEVMNPLVSSVYWYNEDNFGGGGKMQFGQLFDVVNLLRATVGAGGKLTLGADISHVLKNANKYIRPLQIMGMKVCLTVKNSPTIGFCHLDDVSIENFVAQVKIVLDIYGLDGIDLWDDSDEYSMKSIENAAAYPKLIKALREALPKDKMLTVADKGEATSTFFDKEKCGGIEVGKYIDYAYNGYINQYSLPFWTDLEVSNAEWMVYDRKPFAGLEKNRFVCFNRDFKRFFMGDSGYSDDMDYLSFIIDIEGTGEDTSGMIVFRESKGYIAYGIRDNIRGMEDSVMGPMTDMQFLYDPFFGTVVEMYPQQSGGAFGTDRSNTYFRKDW